jgi:phenylacetate-CoA ligase
MSPAGEAFLRSFASTLEDMERDSRARITEWRADQLRQLVLFAYVESPFHRERLAPLFRHGDEPDLNAWQEVPIMRRSDLAAQINRINPASTPPEVGPITVRKTSGTTSDRLSFRTCALAQTTAEVMMNRLYRWHGFDLTAPMASIRFYGSGRRTYPEGITEARWSYPGPPAPHYTIDLRTSVDDLIDWLLRRRPTYLLTFPSIAHEIAEHRLAPRVRELGLKGIIGISEVVAGDTRDRVREQLGCEIAQVYACAEMGCIGLQSAVGEDLLLCEETVFTEILDENDKPVKPGETGKVVITSLYNYATPFIRYEIGDYATRGSDGGTHVLERLQRVEGRRRNALVTSSGQRIWQAARVFRDVAAKIPAKQFQIRQPSLDRIEVIYVPGNGAGSLDADYLGKQFAALIGRPTALAMSPVREIQRTVSGKYERIVSAVTM